MGFTHSASGRLHLMSALGIAVTLVASVLSPESTGQESKPARRDWPQFLGPQRNGISDETGLVDALPADGANEVWRVRGGVGMAGLAIASGRLATMANRDGKQTLLVLEADTGKTLYEVPIAPEYRNQMGNGPRGTPAIAGGVAFVNTGEGILAAIDVTNGKVLWRRNPIEELGGRPMDYGTACSPLVVGNLVVVTPGAPKGTIAAYDTKTGEPRWQVPAGRGDTAGYSSPAVRTIGGVEQIVAFEGKAAIGVSKEGELLWRFPYETDFDCNISVPIAHDGRLFISSGENHGCALLSFKSKGATFDVSPLWESHGPQSVMRNEWQTSLLLGGRLYGMDNVGGAGPVTHLNCVDVNDGKRLWQQLRFGKGNLIAADGKLWISTLKGELALVRATPEKFEELGRVEVLGPTRQAPSLANGLLYLRDDRDIVCLDVRATK